MHKWAVIFLAIIVSSCVTPYRDADLTRAHATLSFARGYTTGTGFGTGTNQEYSISEGGACGSVRRAALFNYLSGTTNERRVVAGEPVHLFANTAYSAVSGVGSTGSGYYTSQSIRWCNATATFTPESGRTYTVVQREIGRYTCRLEVTDATTGAPPTDLSVTEGSGCLPSGEPVPPRL